MFQENEEIVVNDEVYRLEKELGIGGYGEVWTSRCCRSNALVVIKRFHQFDENDLLRMEALRELQLTSRLNGAASISEVIYPTGNQDWAGYIMPFFPGIGLDEWLERTEFSFLDNIFIAIQIAKILTDAHALNVCHGDTHPRNFKIFVRNNVPDVGVIDWDNACIPCLPPPRSPGAKHFLSPETMRALVGNVNHPPNIETERCSVAKIFHWLFFGRESFQTCDESEFETATINGCWNSDPGNGPVDIEVFGGVSNQWMPGDIADLFRRALGCNRDARPSLGEWQTSLLKIVGEGIPICEKCQCPVLMGLQENCPHCTEPFPTLAAVTSDGYQFVANGNPVLLGRDSLGSSSVSKRHAVISKLGPETFITDLGSRNGTFRKSNNGWIRLPDRHRCPIRAGDRVRCGDVNLRIVAA